MATLESNIDEIITAAVDGYPTTGLPNEIEFAIVGYTDTGQFDRNWNMGIGMFGGLLKGLIDHTRSDKPYPQVMITVMTDNNALVPQEAGTARARIIDNGTGNIAKQFCMTNKTSDDTIYELKQRLQPNGVDIMFIDMTDYGVRIRYADEQPLPVENVTVLRDSIKDRSERKTYRYAQRYSLDLGKVNGTQIKVDFSSVKQGKGFSFSGAQIVGICAKKARDSYEIEVELSNSKGVIAADIEAARAILKDALRYILTGIQGGITIAPYNELSASMASYTKLCYSLWRAKLPRVDIQYLSQQVQAQCSKYYLAPAIATLNRSHVVNKSLLDEYYFTDKADGIRSLLYIDAHSKAYLITKSGILLGQRGDKLTNVLNIYPTNTVATYAGKDGGDGPDVMYGSLANDSILDGELIKVQDKYYFLAFDIIVKNSKELSQDPYFDDFKARWALVKAYNLDSIHKTEPALNYMAKTFILYQAEEGKIPGFEQYIKGAQFKQILDTDTGDVINLTYTNKGITYNLDGIVFQPATAPYPALEPTWRKVLKYKPMYHLSVDLRLHYDRNLPKDSALTLGLSAANPEDVYGIYQAQYYSRDHLEVSPYMCYIRLIGGLPKTQEGEIVNKGDIVECRLIFREGQPYWEPMRVRYDKHQPNSFLVHQDTLNQLYEPVSLSNLTVEGGGFGGAQELTVTAHNRWISNGFIIKHNLKIRDDIRLLDLACGNIKSGSSWMVTQKKLNQEGRGRTLKIVGVDNCRDEASNIATAYLYMSNVSTGNRSLFSSDSYAFFNENMLAPLHLSENTKLRDQMALPEGFNIITCIYAIYYAMVNETQFRTFLANVSRNLKVNGFFVCSYMNKEKIIAAMKGKLEVSGKKNNGIIWKITRDSLVNTVFGDKIKISLIGLYDKNEEYFVDLNNPVIIGIMKEYGLELYNDEPYSTENSKHELSPDEKVWASFHHNVSFQKVKLGSTYDVYDRMFSADKAAKKPAKAVAQAVAKPAAKPAAPKKTESSDKPAPKPKIKIKAGIKAKPKSMQAGDTGFREYIGDLLKIEPGPDEYIVHQTNCTGTRAAGLAQKLFTKYPEADTYKTPRTVGTISVHGPVINLYAQDKPGKITSMKQRQNRLSWFRLGLDQIAALKPKVVYFPHRIGCDMAGGNWEEYREILEKWAQTHDFEVHIVKLIDA